MARIKKGPRPRIQVMVDQEVYDCFEDLSKVTGRSMSAIAADVLTEASPSIVKFARIVQDMELDVTGGIRDLAEMALVAAQEAKQFQLELTQEADRRA